MMLTYLACMDHKKENHPVRDCNECQRNLRNYQKGSPASRIRESSGDAFYDEAVGILIGFKKVLEERKGWVDIITVDQAVEEMKTLVRMYGGRV